MSGEKGTETPQEKNPANNSQNEKNTTGTEEKQSLPPPYPPPPALPPPPDEPPRTTLLGTENLPAYRHEGVCAGGGGGRGHSIWFLIMTRRLYLE